MPYSGIKLTTPSHERSIVIQRPFVLTLDESAPQELAGTKAATLAWLRQAGLPVPPGFCVTVAAYGAVLEAAGLHGGEPADQWGRLLEAAVLPAGLEAAVRAAYKALGGGPVAVRSSGVAEDLAGASYAGQYETCLNVVGADAVLETVKRCWASAFTPRAVAYRRVHGGGEPAMGVLVQAMVPASAAGVMFTRSPNGAGDLLIEAAKGLGDAVVSARVTPDRYRLRRDPLAMTSHEPGDPPPTEGGAPTPVLTMGEAAEIGALGLRIEEVLGAPQDIEWAWSDGAPFLLQARPITTLAVSKSVQAVAESIPVGKPHDLWSRANVGEVFPGVLSPLTWSGIRNAFQNHYRDYALRAGMSPDEVGDIFGLFYGRLYTNVGFVHYLVTERLGLSSDYFELSLGGPGRGEGLPLPHKGINWPKLLRNLPAILRFQGENDQMLAQADVILAQGAEWDRRYRGADFSVWSLDSLAQANEEMAGFLGPGWVFHTQAASAAFAALGMLAEALRRMVHDTSPVNDLITGMANLTTADISMALWAIARRAAADPVLMEVIASTPTPDLRETLRSSAAGQRVWRDLEGFLEEHGHRANNELEAMEPRWSDDPRPILAMFKGYVGAGASQDPNLFAARQRQRRDEAEAAVLGRLSSHPLDRLVPVRRTVFRSFLERVRRLLPLRENVKHELLKVGYHQRRALLELGARFVTMGLLRRADDLFFLEVSELHALASAPRRDALATRLGRRIARRRTERERNLAIDPPEIIVPGQPAALRPAASPAVDGPVLRGLGASSGMATGPARVLSDPEEADQLRPGEILVAPFTDPGWTPLFPLVSAIVMDLGGLLSHGAIIAREYGIPAVVNVRTGTRRIRTGQVITVDGTRGVVTLHEYEITAEIAEDAEK